MSYSSFETMKAGCGTLVLLISAAASLAATGGQEATDWPQWRGAKGDNGHPHSSTPLRWDAKRNVEWRTPIPGTGYSSPIVVGGRIYLTTADEEAQEQSLVCVDRSTGRIEWRKILLRKGFMPKHLQNSHASPTPASDGRLVFSTFMNSNGLHVFAVEETGREKWHVEFKPFGLAPASEGCASSPSVYRSSLIVLGDNRRDGFLCALECATGVVRWKVKRKNEGSFCTPVIAKSGGRDQLFVSGIRKVMSYDPRNGNPLWNCWGTAAATANSVAFGTDTLLASGGAPEKDMVCVRTDGKGDVSATHVAWRKRRQITYVPSPLYHEGRYYVVNDVGWITCYDEKDGTSVWHHRIGEKFKSSPLRCGNRIYACAENGKTWVFETGDAYRELAVNPLPESILASPVPSGKDLFIRTRTHLYCIRDR